MDFTLKNYCFCVTILPKITTTIPALLHYRFYYATGIGTTTLPALICYWCYYATGATTLPPIISYQDYYVTGATINCTNTKNNDHKSKTNIKPQSFTSPTLKSKASQCWETNLLVTSWVAGSILTKNRSRQILFKAKVQIWTWNMLHSLDQIITKASTPNLNE